MSCWRRKWNGRPALTIAVFGLFVGLVCYSLFDGRIVGILIATGSIGQLMACVPFGNVVDPCDRTLPGRPRMACVPFSGVVDPSDRTLPGQTLPLDSDAVAPGKAAVGSRDDHGLSTCLQHLMRRLDPVVPNRARG